MVEFVFWCSLLGVLYVYGGYVIVLLSLSTIFKKRNWEVDESHQPVVSIVMAAYNEANKIRAKLENILALDYPQSRIEVLVGSDGSTDGTNEIIREFADCGVEFICFEDRGGKMRTINALVEKAQGTICVFTDVAELFDVSAIGKLVRHFADPSIGIVAGNHIPEEGMVGVNRGTMLYRKIKRIMWNTESRLATICSVDGPIYACRRELFPFPASEVINDDWAVPLGVVLCGKRVVFDPEAIVRGSLPVRTKAFIRQKIRCHAGNYQIFFRYSRMLIPAPVTPWWIYVSHSVLPTLAPWMLIVLLLSSSLLAWNGNGLFALVLAAQALFYVVGIAGWIGALWKISLPIARIVHFFVAANVGSFLGSLAYVFGVAAVRWRKVD